MMEEVEVVTLEDDNNYIIIDTIGDYVYLANEENPKDFCIRKIEKEGEEEFFVGLSGEAEFKKALLEFTKKHKEELETEMNF